MDVEFKRTLPQATDQKNRKQIHVSFYLGLLAGIVFNLGAFSSLGAQQPGFAKPGYDRPGMRYLHPEGVPTGSLAQAYRLGGADQHYFQPVQFLVPKNVGVAVAQDGGYAENVSALFGLQPGQVYRFRLSNLPFEETRELYPTLEVLNRLYPPKGQEFDFPVTIEISSEDIDLALKGNLVTRVVYLESSENPIAVDSTLPATRLTFDIPTNLDPIQVAEQYGKVMAILRIGSRVPDDLPNVQSSFYFGLPLFTVPLVSDASLLK